MIPYGSLVVFVTPKGRRYVKKIEEGCDWHNNSGVLFASSVLAANFGDVVKTSLGVPVRIEKATLIDLIMGIKRKTQIIYPKDIAYIVMKLGVGPGCKIIEAGCGSGGLTLALSWFCGPDGSVYCHEVREEFATLTRKNLDWANLGQNVEIHCQDIEQGFVFREADALFLDMREPWLYLNQALEAVKPGAVLGFLLPTVNQIAELLLRLETQPVGEIEVVEIFLRPWKPIPDRLRPQDRMTAHTGFLVFCRQQMPSEEFYNYLPKDTRERKQQEALDGHRHDGEDSAAIP